MLCCLSFQNLCEPLFASKVFESKTGSATSTCELRCNASHQATGSYLSCPRHVYICKSPSYDHVTNCTNSKHFWQVSFQRFTVYFSTSDFVTPSFVPRNGRAPRLGRLQSSSTKKPESKSLGAFPNHQIIVHGPALRAVCSKS